MKKLDARVCNRRGFLGLALPTCAVTCLAFKALPVVAQDAQAARQAPAPPAGHPFDEQVPRTPTYRQLLTLQFGNVISLAQYLTRTLGRDKAIAILEAHGTERSQQSARNRVERAGNNDFATLKQTFTPGTPGFKNTLVFDVVESTDRVHELKVTECLWANVWRGVGAGDEGFAAICHGDYAFATAFNPKIEMVRDKTLMQGDAFCNHRYLWKG